MAHTLHLDASIPADLALAADLLRQGKLVAFATETVYGLGANALSPAAVAAIFAAKQRPSWDPLIVHIPSVDQLPAITHIPPELEQRISRLTSIFWPGPLTLLLPRSPAIPDAVTAGRPLVGVRVPAHPAAHALLAAAGLPIAAPSANLFGHTSPTTAAHVLADLDNRIAAVLDAGPTPIGLESTVLDPCPTPMVLYRPGAITAQQLTVVTGAPVHVFTPATVPPASQPEPEIPSAALPSPGVGIRHYAPNAPLQLTEPTPAALREAVQRAWPRDPEQKIGILLPEDWPCRSDGTAESIGTIVHPWARWDDPEALAATLFAALRFLDDCGATLILCPLPPAGGLADAIRDRLQKAARPQ